MPHHDNDIPLSAFLTFRLNVLAQLANRAGAHWHEQRSGLSLAEWRIIATLGFFGPLSPSEIANRTLMDKAVISRVKSTLSRKRLIADRPDEQDSRKRRLSLSDGGQRVYDQTMPQAQSRQREMISQFSDSELEALDSAMSRLQAIFERVLGEGPDVSAVERPMTAGLAGADPARQRDPVPSGLAAPRSGAERD
ncbi:MAG: MarR family winged helix-turn-helix transcriptional regulator [Minwuia sp.]|uniref:MarR family winged helix-turn-helix transcriptional regulator n=1 Tax=Minwuia sp. TaxID=2493630 RepID=UPI003A850EED